MMPNLPARGAREPRATLSEPPREDLRRAPQPRSRRSSSWRRRARSPRPAPPRGATTPSPLVTPAATAGTSAACSTTRSTSRSRPTPASTATRRPASDAVVEAALLDVEAFWDRSLRGPLRRALRADLRRLLGVRAGHRAAALRHPATGLLGHRRERLLLPVRRPHRVGQRQPRPRPLRGVRRLHARASSSPTSSATPSRPAPSARGRHDHDRAAGRLLRRGLVGRRRGRQLAVLRRSPSTTSTRPSSGFLDPARRRRHLRPGPRRPRHRLRPDRGLLGGLRAGPRALRGLPRPVRRWSARHRRGALHRPGGLRPRRQPAAAGRCRPRPGRPRGLLDACSSPSSVATRGRHWRGSTAVDPATDEVDLRRRRTTATSSSTRPSTASPDTIYIDGVNLVPALYEIGDYAVATEMARQYAYAAQVRMGNVDNSLASNLQADCFAGVYASQRVPGEPGGAEARALARRPRRGRHRLPAATATASESVVAGEATVGTAFQRFDAYRSGFIEGTAACDALLAEELASPGAGPAGLAGQVDQPLLRWPRR